MTFILDGLKRDEFDFLRIHQYIVLSLFETPKLG